MLKLSDRLSRSCLLLGVSCLVFSGARAGVFSTEDDFATWSEYSDYSQDDFSKENAQPLTRQISPSNQAGGAQIRFDGKSTNSVRPVILHDLDFELPNGSGSSSTVFFRSALFQLDLPFLRFDRATATYAFKESWKPPSVGDAFFGDGEIRLAEVDAWHNFVESERNVYDVEGRRIDGAWSNAFQGESVLLSSAVLIGDEHMQDIGIVTAMGGLALQSSEGEGSSELGIAGILTLLCLAGVVLFITLEFSRDKLDRFRG